jgi:hypothetical protein
VSGFRGRVGPGAADPSVTRNEGGPRFESGRHGLDSQENLAAAEASKDGPDGLIVPTALPTERVTSSLFAPASVARLALLRGAATGRIEVERRSGLLEQQHRHRNPAPAHDVM